METKRGTGSLYSQDIMVVELINQYSGSSKPVEDEENTAYSEDDSLANFYLRVV